MINFIRHFTMYWRNYSGFKYFCKKRKYEEQAKAEGVGNRFLYAWKCSVVAYKHKDRYSKRCTGDCENCKLKHC